MWWHPLLFLSPGSAHRVFPCSSQMQQAQQHGPAYSDHKSEVRLESRPAVSDVDLAHTLSSKAFGSLHCDPHSCVDLPVAWTILYEIVKKQLSHPASRCVGRFTSTSGRISPAIVCCQWRPPQIEGPTQNRINPLPARRGHCNGKRFEPLSLGICLVPIQLQ